jgi:hypothetical protein
MVMLPAKNESCLGWQFTGLNFQTILSIYKCILPIKNTNESFVYQVNRVDGVSAGRG